MFKTVSNYMYMYMCVYIYIYIYTEIHESEIIGYVVSALNFR